MDKRWTRWLLDFLLFLLVIIGFSLLVANSYLASNKTKILDNLPFLDNGIITFEEASISIFNDFPAATLRIKNVQVKDSLFAAHQTPVLQADLLSLNTKTIELQQIHLQDGVVNLVTTEQGYNNLQSLRREKQTSKKETAPSFQVQATEVNVKLVNMDLRVKNAIKNTSIVARAEELYTQLSIQEEAIGI